ncbi:MAG TPA: hypothetical protein VFI91_01780 [Longimicrobiaceae bacterium]|nr:hypothetical protein [Longimicrobiaceae bacterium]
MRTIRRSVGLAFVTVAALASSGCGASLNSPIGIGLRGNSFFFTGGAGSCGSLFSDPAAFLNPASAPRYYIFDAVKNMQSKATALGSSSKVLSGKVPTTAASCY